MDVGTVEMFPCQRNSTLANESSLPTLNVSQGRNTIILDNGAPTSGCVGSHREGRPVDELARQGPQSRNGRRCLVERADLRHVGKSCSLRAGGPREHITAQCVLGAMTLLLQVRTLFSAGGVWVCALLLTRGEG